MTAPAVAAAAERRAAAKTAAKKAAASSAGSPAPAPAPAGDGGSSAGSGTRGRPADGGGGGNRVSAPSLSAPRIARPSTLLAEFILCAVLVGLSPLTDKHREDTAADWMARASAVCALFFLLSLLSAGGARSAKVANGFGGLVTLTLLVSQRSVFTVLAQRFNTPAAPPADEPIPSPPRVEGPAVQAPRPGRAAPA